MSDAQMQELLNGVSTRWLDVLLARGSDACADEIAALRTIVAAITRGPIVPELARVFQFARYPWGPRVVVVAPEPYLEAGAADGLAWSSAADPPSAMSRRVIDCIERMAAPVATTDAPVVDAQASAPPAGTLEHLAVQGWVLITATPTAARGTRTGSHTALWREWMHRLAARIARASPDGVPWLAWGASTYAFATASGRGFHRAPHPTLAGFAAATGLTPNLATVWRARDSATDIFTDCSARGNGRGTSARGRGARGNGRGTSARGSGRGTRGNSRDTAARVPCRASWGVACTRGLLAGRVWAGECEGETRAGVAHPPTNIRGEGWAIVRALELAMRLPAWCPVRVLTDSLFWINMCCQYIPQWIERRQPWHERANADIIAQLVPFLARVYGPAARPGFDLLHVRAWHDLPVPAAGTEAHHTWAGNRAAERAAESALGIATHE